MLYCDAATFCRRRNDADIMTDETGRRCAQESIDIIIMKNKYYYLFIKNNFDYLLILQFDDFCSNFQITTHARGQPNNVLCMETISSSAREPLNRYIR